MRRILASVPKLWDLEDLGFLTEDLVSEIVDELGVSVGTIYRATEDGGFIPEAQTTKYIISDALISPEMKRKLENHYREYLRRKDGASIPHQGPGKGIKRSKESA